MSEVIASRKMSKQHRMIFFTFIAGALAFVGLLMRGLSIDQKKVPSALIGLPAFDFDVVPLQGKEFLPKAIDPARIHLSAFKGRPLILNFWASWCVSCREEAREMETFWQRHKGDDIAFAGIAIQDTPEAALEFAHAFGKTYLLALDDKGGAAIDYGVTGVPETFFIDKNGVIRFKEAGPVTVEMLENYLQQLNGL